MTSNTDNCAMERRFARKSMTEVRMAARVQQRWQEADSARPLTTSSETCYQGGRTPDPTSISSSGAESLIRLTSAVTARTRGKLEPGMLMS